MLKTKTMSKLCACNGIRLCRLCEHIKASKVHEIKQRSESTTRTVLYYCGTCEKAFEQSSGCVFNTNQVCNHEGPSIPFPGFRVIPDFVSEAEEKQVISLIDSVPWVNSQSGRRKQDYGPKVNFKKRKVKTDVFTGLPPFSKSLIEKFREIDILNDFETVELCNLEYNPERGSGIDAHKDDEWLWGERLVTLNLLTDIRYTMTYSSGTKKMDLLEPERRNGMVSCDHTVRHRKDGEINNNLNDNVLLKSENQRTNDSKATNKMLSSVKISTASKNENLVGTNFENTDIFNETSASKNAAGESKNIAIQGTESGCRMNSSLNDSKRISEAAFSQSEKLEKEENGVLKAAEVNSKAICTENSESTTKGCQSISSNIDFDKIEVEIFIPRRSLIIVYGPARTDWNHGIKPEHIGERRIGITLRELTPLFREGGEQENLGKKIIEKAKSFQGISVGEYDKKVKLSQ